MSPMRPESIEEEPEVVDTTPLAGGREVAASLSPTICSVGVLTGTAPWYMSGYRLLDTATFSIADLVTVVGSEKAVRPGRVCGT